MSFTQNCYKDHYTFFSKHTMFSKSFFVNLHERELICQNLFDHYKKCLIKVGSVTNSGNWLLNICMYMCVIWNEQKNKTFTLVTFFLLTKGGPYTAYIIKKVWNVLQQWTKNGGKKCKKICGINALDYTCLKSLLSLLIGKFLLHSLEKNIFWSSKWSAFPRF